MGREPWGWGGGQLISRKKCTSVKDCFIDFFLRGAQSNTFLHLFHEPSSEIHITHWNFLSDSYALRGWTRCKPGPKVCRGDQGWRSDRYGAGMGCGFGVPAPCPSSCVAGGLSLPSVHQGPQLASAQSSVKML